MVHDLRVPVYGGRPGFGGFGFGGFGGGLAGGLLGGLAAGALLGGSFGGLWCQTETIPVPLSLSVSLLWGLSGILMAYIRMYSKLTSSSIHVSSV